MSMHMDLYGKFSGRQSSIAAPKSIHMYKVPMSVLYLASETFLPRSTGIVLCS